MEKIKKGYILKFMTLIIAMLFILNNIADGVTLSNKYNHKHLRSPLGDLKPISRMLNILKADQHYFENFGETDYWKYLKAPSMAILPNNRQMIDPGCYVVDIKEQGGPFDFLLLDQENIEWQDLSGVIYKDENKDRIGNCKQGTVILVEAETNEDVIGTQFIVACDTIGGKITIKGKHYLFLYHNFSEVRNQNIYMFIKWLLDQSSSQEDFECFISVFRDFNERDSYGDSSEEYHKSLNEIIEDIRILYPKTHIEAVDNHIVGGLCGSMTVSTRGVVLRTAEYDKGADQETANWDNAKIEAIKYFNSPIETSRERSKDGLAAMLNLQGLTKEQHDLLNKGLGTFFVGLNQVRDDVGILSDEEIGEIDPESDLRKISGLKIYRFTKTQLIKALRDVKTSPENIEYIISNLISHPGRFRDEAGAPRAANLFILDEHYALLTRLSPRLKAQWARHERKHLEDITRLEEDIQAMYPLNEAVVALMFIELYPDYKQYLELLKKFSKSIEKQQQINRTDIQEYMMLKDKLSRLLRLWNEKVIALWREREKPNDDISDVESSRLLHKWKTKALYTWLDINSSNILKDFGGIKTYLLYISSFSPNHLDIFIKTRDLDSFVFLDHVDRQLYIGDALFLGSFQDSEIHIFPGSISARYKGDERSLYKEYKSIGTLSYIIDGNGLFCMPEIDEHIAQLMDLQKQFSPKPLNQAL